MDGARGHPGDGGRVVTQNVHVFDAIEQQCLRKRAQRDLRDLFLVGAGRIEQPIFRSRIAERYGCNLIYAASERYCGVVVGG